MSRRPFLFPALLGALLAQGALAQDFRPVFASSSQDIPPPTSLGNVNHVHVLAGVDSDEDGIKEIIYVRVDANDAEADTDPLTLAIYEATGADNGYELKYTDLIHFPHGALGNFNQYGQMLVADLDGQDGAEIWLLAAGPFAKKDNAEVDIPYNAFVYASTADDQWGKGQTDAPGEYSQALLLVSKEHKRPNGAAAADFDGDRKVELVFGDAETGQVPALSHAGGRFADATATLRVESQSLLGEHETGTPYAIHAVDLNGDGQPEAVLGTHDRAGFVVIEGSGPNSYRAAQNLTPGLAPFDYLYKPGALAAGDLDGDGIVSVYGLAGSNAVIYGFTGLSAGSLSSVTPGLRIVHNQFGTVTTTTASNGDLLSGQSLSISDIDEDGRPELVAAIQRDGEMRSGGEVVFLEYGGTGSELSPSSFLARRGDLNGVTAPETIFAATAGTQFGVLDMDMDGKVEVVIGTAGAQSPAIQVFEAPRASRQRTR
ncbi:MAG: VCBS repeat-containing protein [Sumerlaeia bacterium]